MAMKFFYSGSDPRLKTFHYAAVHKKSLKLLQNFITINVQSAQKYTTLLKQCYRFHPWNNVAYFTSANLTGVLVIVTSHIIPGMEWQLADAWRFISCAASSLATKAWATGWPCDSLSTTAAVYNACTICWYSTCRPVESQMYLCNKQLVVSAARCRRRGLLSCLSMMYVMCGLARMLSISSCGVPHIWHLYWRLCTHVA